MIRVRSSVLDAHGGSRYRFNITIQESTHEDK